MILRSFSARTGAGFFRRVIFLISDRRSGEEARAGRCDSRFAACAILSEYISGVWEICSTGGEGTYAGLR